MLPVFFRVINPGTFSRLCGFALSRPAMDSSPFPLARQQRVLVSGTFVAHLHINLRNLPSLVNLPLQEEILTTWSNELKKKSICLRSSFPAGGGSQRRLLEAVKHARVYTRLACARKHVFHAIVSRVCVCTCDSEG